MIELTLQSNKSASKGRVKFSGYMQRINFPKTQDQLQALENNGGGFYIAKFNVVKILENPNGVDLVCGDIISVKGQMPTLKAGALYDITGEATTDYYGVTVKVTTITTEFKLETYTAKRAFLERIATDLQVDNLFATFKDPIEPLENENYGALINVPGVGELTAKRLIRAYKEEKQLAAAYVAFEKYGLTSAAIHKIVQAYGGSPELAVSKITANPYCLITDVPGYGWTKADTLAHQMGWTDDSPERAKAFMCYYLQQQAEDKAGNLWVPVNELLGQVYVTCAPIEQEVMFQCLRDLINLPVGDKQKLHFEEGERDDNGMELIPDRIALDYYYKLEQEATKHLIRLQEAAPSVKIEPELIEETIKEEESRQNFVYTEEQRRFIHSALSNQVGILSGLAGGGKSSAVSPVVKSVLKAAHGNQSRILQCALSGRASSKLNEITHIKGCTIHKALGIMDSETGQVRYDEHNPLDVDFVVLDETSMVPIDIFVKLLRAIPSGAKFLMVGDYRQLESVGAGNVFMDCINSKRFPRIDLTKIHRQAARSGIITEAAKVAEGVPLVAKSFIGEEVRGELHDLKLVVYNDPALSQDKIIHEFKHLYFDLNIPVNDIQVIVPMKDRGIISCYVLNQQIQSIVNGVAHPEDITVPYKSDATEGENADPQNRTVTFRLYDKVIVTRNQYHTPTYRNGELSREVAIFNGNIGTITKMLNDGVIVNLTEQGEVFIHKNAMMYLQLGYAITVHKKQGDSSPYIIFGLDNGAYTLFSKELVYTAITRARKMCVIVAQNMALYNSIKTTRVKYKQTWLQELLQNTGCPTALT